MPQSTQGSEMQYTLPLGELLSSQRKGTKTALTTNTLKANNTKSSQNASFNPHSLSSFELLGSDIPSYIASTVGNLVNNTLSIPGYTPGGAPLAGGQFPSNYPFTQTDINNIYLNPFLLLFCFTPKPLSGYILNS